MTLEELKDVVAGVATALAETDRLLKEQARQAALRTAETDRQLRTLRQEIGALGAKFGGFTEGMAFPAMTKILEERFHMDVVATRVVAHLGSDSMELDVPAHANSGVNAVCAVEVKSRLRRRDISRLERKLGSFSSYFPEYRGKKLFGLMAVVDGTREQRREVLESGLYFARIHDDAFQLDVPEDFEPRVYPL